MHGANRFEFINLDGFSCIKAIRTEWDIQCHQEERSLDRLVDWLVVAKKTGFLENHR